MKILEPKHSSPFSPLGASGFVRVTRSWIEQSAFEVRETASSEDGEEALARRDVDKLETVFLYYLLLYFLPSFNPNPLFTFITTLLSRITLLVRVATSPSDVEEGSIEHEGSVPLRSMTNLESGLPGQGIY